MSKIYNKYLELKNNDPNKLYLFHSGKFYIFIKEDADKINEYVVLKRTRFTNDIYKCGFPDNSYEDYIRVFNNHKLDIVVIESNEIENVVISENIEKDLINYKEIINIIKKIDINSLTPIESIIVLNNIVECINDKNSR